MQNIDFNFVEGYVKDIFKINYDDKYTYHDLTHTKSVVEFVIKIAIAENISRDELDLIKIAAWFHDTGYLFNPHNHEEKSCEIAESFLQNNHFSEAEIDKIKRIIMATKVPHNPTSHLEKIICDADLHHLGESDFYQRNDLFRLELEKTSGTIFTENEWILSTLEFLKEHKFFTKFAINNFDPRKRNYIKELRQNLQDLS